jgi:hypothetical protein
MIERIDNDGPDIHVSLHSKAHSYVRGRWLGFHLFWRPCLGSFLQDASNVCDDKIGDAEVGRVRVFLQTGSKLTLASRFAKTYLSWEPELVSMYKLLVPVYKNTHEIYQRQSQQTKR